MCIRKHSESFRQIAKVGIYPMILYILYFKIEYRPNFFKILVLSMKQAKIKLLFIDLLWNLQWSVFHGKMLRPTMCWNHLAFSEFSPSSLTYLPPHPKIKSFYTGYNVILPLRMETDKKRILLKWLTLITITTFKSLIPIGNTIANYSQGNYCRSES